MSDESEMSQEQLLRHCEGLAANQCHHGYGGEHGHHRCRYQDQLAAVTEERDALRRGVADAIAMLRFSRQTSAIDRLNAALAAVEESHETQ